MTCSVWSCVSHRLSLSLIDIVIFDVPFFNFGVVSLAMMDWILSLSVIDV